MADLRVPLATYRLQLNRDFRFADACALVLYLHELGISDIYASPIFKARPGSTHGYDVTDPTSLNPELGTEGEFEALIRELKQHGTGLLLDIVPNHMAASSENPWWMDVLENGPSSPYARYFDIDWHPEPSDGVPQNTVLLPILGGPYRSVLENGDLILGLDEKGFFVHYHEARLPLDPKSYRALLAYRIEELKESLGENSLTFRELASLIEAIDGLPARTDTRAEAVKARRRDKETVKERLWRLYSTHPEIKTFIDANVSAFNNTTGEPRSFDLLDGLLSDQAYRLAFWREGIEKLNYRRFFDISDLIGVCVEEPEVFEATHALAFRLADEGKVTGLRIDHVDGLYDPLDYLRRLQGRLGATKSTTATTSFHVIVEKILGRHEDLPDDWPVYGTTGYDFLNALNAVFVDARGLEVLDTAYRRFTGSRSNLEDVVYESKKRVMQELFAGEVRRLAHRLNRLAQDLPSHGLKPEELGQALVEMSACLPVYRTYILGFDVRSRDRSCIEGSITEARRKHPSVSAAAFDFVRRILLLDLPAPPRPEQCEQWLGFVMRWQQFTGAVMAKGLEDTALYLHNRLISLNEVGSGPGDADSPAGVERFHQHNWRMLQQWPHTMNATSTHDTKRSEDVRARINFLSECPAAWARRVRRWAGLNRDKKSLINGRPVPDPNEEALFYQTLIGAWPLQAEEMPGFRRRLKASVTKAAREAKTHTNWLQPNEAYERALAGFADACLDTSSPNEFLDDFLRFQPGIAYYGALNSLAQVLLKIASPGVPDFYQGTELWDFSLVDPDNRRPVDFSARRRLLEELKAREAGDPAGLIQELLASWHDGRVKMYLIWKALGFRRAHAGLFQEGAYVPLSASGERREHVVAFARRKRDDWALAAVPRLVAGLGAPGRPPLGRRPWRDCAIPLATEAPERWVNVLTRETLQASRRGRGRALAVHEIFRRFPVALLLAVSG
jgi:(1->4)-alpha-D-glucan 1-alpha-D-glucosylmutase